MAKITKVCVGESLVGEGNEVAHIDLIIGPRGLKEGQAEMGQRFCQVARKAVEMVGR